MNVMSTKNVTTFWLDPIGCGRQKGNQQVLDTFLMPSEGKESIQKGVPCPWASCSLFEWEQRHKAIHTARMKREGGWWLEHLAMLPACLACPQCGPGLPSPSFKSKALKTAKEPRSPLSVGPASCSLVLFLNRNQTSSDLCILHSAWMVGIFWGYCSQSVWKWVVNDEYHRSSCLWMAP